MRYFCYISVTDVPISVSKNLGEYEREREFYTFIFLHDLLLRIHIIIAFLNRVAATARDADRLKSRVH